MSVPHQFSLKWNNYSSHITLAFESLRSQEDLVDVTLSCEGRKIRAHKILLSACSSYFRDIFKENPCQHPVIIFKNVKYDDLVAIIEFMYQGEVNVQQESLPSFLHTAELLCVQGLTENKEQQSETTTQCETIQLPKLTKIVPMTQIIQTGNTVANLIPRTRINLNTSTSNEFIEIPQHYMKKPKITENELPTEPEPSEEIEYIPQTVKMEIPEYINMTTPIQQESQNTSTDVEIQTDEQIMQQEGDDDEDGKHYMQEDSFEIVDGSEVGLKPDQTKSESNMESDSAETSDLTGVELGRVFSSQNSDSTKAQDGKMKFRCNICWKVFKHPNSLTLHKDMHTGKTKCPVCFRSFSRSYDMKSHMSKIHKITLKVETKLNLK